MSEEERIAFLRKELHRHNYLYYVKNSPEIGDNILNREYKEYTNRSRYYAHDMGRDVRCMIAWNF